MDKSAPGTGAVTRRLWTGLDGRFLLYLGIATLAVLNVLLISIWLPWAIRHGPWDFYVYRIASLRLFDGTMYQLDPGYIYTYSPVFAWLFAPVGALGIWVWRALHVAAVMLIPSWKLRLVVLASWPFWVDTWEGNTLTFIAVAGFWALRGNRWAGLAFLGLALLIPRPLVVPLGLYLLWKQPGLRVPFAGMVVVHGLAVLATGYAFDWLAALPNASHDLDSLINLSPSRFLGYWWLVIGAPLAAWLAWKGRTGWAGLSMSPYLLEPYLLVLLFEATRRATESAGSRLSPLGSRTLGEPAAPR